MPRFTMLLVLLVCPSLAEGQTLSRREKGDLAIQARAILNKHCGECHGDANNPSRLAVLEYTKVTSKTVPVPFVSLESKRSQILEFIESGAMPPGDKPGPSEAEIEILKKWVNEKAPDYPKAFDDHTTLSTMLKDFEGLEEDMKPHVRYLSLGHLVPADGTPGALNDAEQRLRKSLLVGTGKPVAPEPIDATATLFRLDLRLLGWDAPDLFEKWENNSARGVIPLMPYDLILMEYPNAMSATDELAKKIKDFQETTKQRRLVPFLKADWFSKALGGAKETPKATPLALELQSLVKLSESIAKKGKQPDGPAFTIEKIRFTGENVSSAAPPIGSMYAGNAEPKPSPFDVTAEAIDSKGVSMEGVFVDEPFKMKLKADHDGSFHLLQVWTDGTIDYIVTSGGSTFVADKARVFATTKDPTFRITSLITGLGDGYEHFVVLASEKETDPPMIVRSRHSERPIWRFLPDESKPVVRRVITLHVANK
jgi:mono/diheme cytochrome c family protein